MFFPASFLLIKKVIWPGLLWLECTNLKPKPPKLEKGKAKLNNLVIRGKYIHSSCSRLTMNAFKYQDSWLRFLCIFALGWNHCWVVSFIGMCLFTVTTNIARTALHRPRRPGEIPKDQCSPTEPSPFLARPMGFSGWAQLTWDTSIYHPRRYLLISLQDHA